MEPSRRTSDALVVVMGGLAILAGGDRPSLLRVLLTVFGVVSVVVGTCGLLWDTGWMQRQRRRARRLWPAPSWRPQHTSTLAVRHRPTKTVLLLKPSKATRERRRDLRELTVTCAVRRGKTRWNAVTKPDSDGAVFAVFPDDFTGPAGPVSEGEFRVEWTLARGEELIYAVKDRFAIDDDGLVVRHASDRRLGDPFVASDLAFPE